MGIHEHAALIEAIMLNFPEIYEEHPDSNHNGESGVHDATGPAIHPSSPA